MKNSVKNQNKLTVKQNLYFNMMRANSGVVHLTGKPGIAKTSTVRCIAEKINYQYLDIRLSMVDDTEVGLYPFRKNLNGVETLDFAVPLWAIMANSRPTIVNFDELKRANQSVRNASLQILLERQIGINFKFNDDVHFIITDNIGAEDGTDVDQFDRALNNRLIHVDFSLTLAEWVEDFAKERVHPQIIEFLTEYPEYFYVTPKNGEAAFANPRSWTFLSDYIKTNLQDDTTSVDLGTHIAEIAHYYIGNSSVKFSKYLIDKKDIKISDILNAKPSKIEALLKSLKRDKKSELIRSFNSYDMSSLTTNEQNNLALFIIECDMDESANFIRTIMIKVIIPGPETDKITQVLQIVKKTCPAVIDYVKSHQEVASN